jgi:hypothetical protein
MVGFPIGWRSDSLTLASLSQSALYLLCGLVNVALGIWQCDRSSRYSRGCDCGSCVIFYPLAAVKRATYAGVRFAFRYLSKVLQRARGRDGGFKTEDEDSMKGSVLDVELAQKVVQDSSTERHFIDLLQSNPAIAQQHQRNGNGDMLLLELRQSTCSGASKSQCKVCSIQICSVSFSPSDRSDRQNS